jgi:hypothetical protein
MLGWGENAKDLVGPLVVVLVCEGVDEVLEFVDPAGQVVGGVEPRTSAHRTY